MLTEIPELESPLEYGGSGSAADRPAMHHGTLLVFTLLWGSNFVLAEVALRDLAPISFSVSRFMIAAVVLVGIYYAQGLYFARKAHQPFRLFAHVEKQDWVRLLAVSLLGATLAPWLGIEGLNLTSGGRASLWLALCPVLSAGIGYVLHTEAIRRLGMTGLVVAGLGTIGLTADGLGLGERVFRGDVYLLLAICCISIELHLMKPLVVKYGATSMVAMRTVIGGSVYLLIASPVLLTENWTDLGAWTWVAILLGGAIGVGLGQWAKVRALNVLGPTRVVLYGNLVPPATLLIAWIALGSNPTLLEIIAGLLILIGAAIIQIGDPHREKISQYSNSNNPKPETRNPKQIT